MGKTPIELVINNVKIPQFRDENNYQKFQIKE
jgi:hypothetical protein